MQPRKPQKSATPNRSAKPNKQASSAKGKGANRPNAARPSKQVVIPVSTTAEELARLVVLQAREPEVAGVLADDLPEVMAAILHSAKGRDATSVASRSLLMRLMRHPAASAAEKDASDRGRPAALRSALVGRLTGAPGRAPVTVTVEPDAKALPF